MFLPWIQFYPENIKYAWLKSMWFLFQLFLTLPIILTWSEILCYLMIMLYLIEESICHSGLNYRIFGALWAWNFAYKCCYPTRYNLVLVSLSFLLVLQVSDLFIVFWPVAGVHGCSLLVFYKDCKGVIYIHTGSIPVPPTNTHKHKLS